MITCPKCKEEKENSFFSKDKRTKSGLKCWCKKCSTKWYNKWRVKNKKHSAEYMRKYRKDNFERIREISKKAYLSNQERVLKYRKSEKGILSQRNANKKRQVIKKYTSDDSINTAFLIELIKKQEYKCAFCFKEIKLSVDIKNKFACDLDHKKPLSKGGKHIDSNVQFLCKKCNAYKSNKIL